MRAQLGLQKSCYTTNAPEDSRKFGKLCSDRYEREKDAGCFFCSCVELFRTGAWRLLLISLYLNMRTTWTSVNSGYELVEFVPILGICRRRIF